MRKQELIHLHGLLAQIQTHYEKKTETDIEQEDYLSLNVQPTSIHQSKTAHKDAVFALAESITEEFVENEIKSVSATAD